MTNQARGAKVAAFPDAHDTEERKALMLSPLHTSTLAPQTLGQALEWAHIMCGSQLVPEGMRGNPADVLIAILWGNQLGMSVVQALQNIAVVNGRATIWGDAYLAIVMGRAGDDLEKFEETWEPDVEGGKWTTTVKRKGPLPETVRSFSMADAKKIHYYASGGQKVLAEKDTYRNYPRRMCKFKARNEALRDTFPDLLLNIGVREFEGEDDPARVGEGATADAKRQGEPLAELLERYEPDVAASIVRGFDELALSTAERRVKLREHGDNSAALLAWLKEEFTLRKTSGRQRQPAPRTGTKRPTTTDAATTIDVRPEPTREPQQADDPRGDVQAAADDAKAGQAEELRRAVTALADGVAAPPAPAANPFGKVRF